MSDGGTSGLDAPLKLGRALESGENVAVLVDQHTTQGVDVVFFGRWAKANPLVAHMNLQTARGQIDQGAMNPMIGLLFPDNDTQFIVVSTNEVFDGRRSGLAGAT